jgi:GxxExxY protein
MDTPREIDDYCNKIRQTAYELYRYLGQGHLEKIYENGLVNRLTKLNLNLQQQVPISVRDEDGTILGNMIADLIVQNQIIIEGKAVDHILPIHKAQLLGYLRSTDKKYGLLINFGSPRFYIKRFVCSI